MTLALQEPGVVADLVAVDNAPVDAILSRDFAKYVQGMRKIQDAGVTRQSEADKILQKYEEVRLVLILPIFTFAFGLTASSNGTGLAYSAIPTREPPSPTRLQYPGVPISLRYIREIVRQSWRFSFQEPLGGSIRKTCSVRSGNEEQVRPRRGLAINRSIFPSVPLGRRRRRALAHIRTTGSV